MAKKRLPSIGMFDEVCVVTPDAPVNTPDDEAAPGPSGTGPLKISKSKFVAGVQCLKRLYWQVHHPGWGAEPDDSALAVIEQGKEVGRLARQLFPGGVEVEAGPENLGDAIRITKGLIANSSVPTIFEATFEHGNVLVRVDILQRRDKNRWRLLEVKSTTDFKDHHLYDVGIQARVVTRSGIKLSSCNLIHLSSGYVFQGGSFDLKRLFRVRNLNRQLTQFQDELTRQRRSEFRILRQSEPPEVAPGRHCRQPVRCEFFDLCNPWYPEHHVRCLPRIGTQTIEELKALGVESICDIPEDVPLTKTQQHAATAVKSGKPFIAPELAEELDDLKYPLCFMDFETIYPALPRFAGMAPYDHIPFQWSVHRQEEPAGPVQHFEYLAEDASDPRPVFTESLCKTVACAGSIVVYNEEFEYSRLDDLARWFPEHSRELDKIKGKLWDLLRVIRRCVYHPVFRGSFSLKSVLPAFVPEMSYDSLEISDGTQAGRIWSQLIDPASWAHRDARLKTALLEYCEQDTLGMLKLVMKLRQACANG